MGGSTSTGGAKPGSQPSYGSIQDYMNQGTGQAGSQGQSGATNSGVPGPGVPGPGVAFSNGPVSFGGVSPNLNSIGNLALNPSNMIPSPTTISSVFGGSGSSGGLSGSPTPALTPSGTGTMAAPSSTGLPYDFGNTSSIGGSHYEAQIGDVNKAYGQGLLTQAQKHADNQAILAAKKAAKKGGSAVNPLGGGTASGSAAITNPASPASLMTNPAFMQLANFYPQSTLLGLGNTANTKIAPGLG